MAYIRAYEKNRTMAKLSLIPAGETEGVSNTGERFTEEGLDFSAGGTISGMPVSQSYVNYMGTWSYTIKCPVERAGQEIGTLYAEYVYDAIDQSLPDGFYNKQASLYIMDAQSQRFVLKPKGMGQRSAGHLNLADFYRANNIQDPAIQAEVEADLTGMRFLAAEDNEINPEILAELLEIEGASCEVASDGRQAVERFRASAPGEFDAILMDVQMPVMPMTGWAVGAQAEHREDAMQVMDVILSDEALQLFSETNRVISPSKNVKVDCVPALRPLNDRIEEGVYVLGSNAGVKVEQWGNTCLIVRELLASATVEECMASFDKLQDAALNK